MISANFEEIKLLEDSNQLGTYSKYQLSVEKGKGAYVWDSNGNRYLDLYGGHAVCITGHCHPKIISAVSEQLNQLIFYSNVVYNSTRAKAAKAIVDFAPSGFTQVFFCNSGAEANETAIKAARKHTGRTNIIAMKGGFHGRTYGAMSITGFDKYRIFPPHLPGVAFADFGCIESLEGLSRELKGDIACVIFEPVQSMAGCKVASYDYYKKVREFCTRSGIVLIYDEVQTGFGRIGKPFFGDLCGVQPDLITGAKGVGSGIPAGIVLFRKEIAEKIKLGEQGTTFGGGPVASAAILATLEVINEERLCDNAHELGLYIKEKLLNAEINCLKSVLGAGLLIGIEFNKSAKKLVQEMLKKGIIIGSSEDPNILRLLPPLTITRAHCDEFVSALKDCAAEL